MTLWIFVAYFFIHTWILYLALLQICLILNSSIIFPWPMFQSSLTTVQWFSTLAAHWNHWEALTKILTPVFFSRDNDVIGLNCQPIQLEKIVCLIKRKIQRFLFAMEYPILIGICQKLKIYTWMKNLLRLLKKIHKYIYLINPIIKNLNLDWQ